MTELMPDERDLLPERQHLRARWLVPVQQPRRRAPVHLGERRQVRHGDHAAELPVVHRLALHPETLGNLTLAQANRLPRLAQADADLLG